MKNSITVEISWDYKMDIDAEDVNAALQNYYKKHRFEVVEVHLDYPPDAPTLAYQITNPENTTVTTKIPEHFSNL